MRDKNVGDWISADLGEEGVDGIPGDNNRTNDNLEGEANPAVSSPVVRALEFDQVATKPPLQRFVTFSDTVDSNRMYVNHCHFMKSQLTNKPMLVVESPSDCLSTGS